MNQEENRYLNQPESFKELHQPMQQVAIEWIQTYLRPRKTALFGRSSYGIKHILDHDTGLYMTNGQFKGAMLACGFEPVNPNDLNWNYRLSMRSPGFINDEERFKGQHAAKLRQTVRNFYNEKRNET